MHIRKNLLSLAIMSSLALSLPAFANQGHGNGPANDNSHAPDSAQSQSATGTTTEHVNICQLEPDASSVISAEVEAQLQFMAEEEKMARDVYLYLNDLWDQNVFVNISKAEQAHFDSVEKFLAAYSIADPSTGINGIFTNTDLQNLYDTLTADGSTSLIDALMVGALIEEVDIKDLISAIEQTDDQAIAQMYTNLMYGSYNHLKAFVNQLETLGVTYTSQGVLTQQQVDDILNSEQSTTAMNSAAAIDGSGTAATSESCFVNQIMVNSQLVINNSELNGEDIIDLSSNIKVSTQDQGKNARLVTVAAWTSEQGEFAAFMRDNQTWISWDGNIDSLSAAEQVMLTQQQQFQVFAGNLAELPGDYAVSVGYVLDDGTVVYNAEPMFFKVK